MIAALEDGEGVECGGTLSTLWGFRADMDMAVVITYCSLLPTVSHLCSARRDPKTSEECQRKHQAGLVRQGAEALKLKLRKIND